MTAINTVRTGLKVVTTVAVASSMGLLLIGCTSPFENNPFGPETPGLSQSDSTQQDPAQPPAPGNTADDETPNKDDAARAAGKVTFMVDNQSFTFTPTTCVQKAQEELRVSGPGIAHTNNSPAFLDAKVVWVDSWPQGTVTVYLDADKSAPTGIFFKAIIGDDDESGYGYSMGDMMEGYDLRAGFSTHDGMDMGMGALTINCE